MVKEGGEGLLHCQRLRSDKLGHAHAMYTDYLYHVRSLRYI